MGTAPAGTYNGYVPLLSSIPDEHSMATVESSSKPKKGGKGTEAAGLGVTDLYSRLMAAENDLIAEKTKRNEVEVHLTKILKDVDAKAPLIASQKRDMNRIIESHSLLTLKLDNLTAEHDELKENYTLCTHKLNDMMEFSSSQEKMIVDLSCQIQHLLKRNYDSMPLSQRPTVALVEPDFGASASPASQQLNVTFDDIADLQSRNAYLLKAVHKLSQENARLSEMSSSLHAGQSASKADPAHLKAAQEELESMREARKKTEEMVKVLVQQRDLYRSIVDNNGNVDLNALVPYVPFTANKENAGQLVSADTAMEIESLNFKIKQHETDFKHNKERISRLEAAEALLLESLDQSKRECSDLRLKSAEASNDARFQRERVARMEDSVKALQLECASTNQRKDQVENMVRALEQESYEKNASLVSANEKMRVLESELRGAACEVEVARAAEQRLLLQLAEQREEIKNQVALGDSIRRIESGLSSRMEEERLAVIAERDALASNIEALRKKIVERGIIEEERTLQLDGELRAARETLDARTVELADLRAEVLVEQGELRTVSERAALLEKQLSLAQDRLSAVMGAQVLDSAKANENAQKEALLEQANKQLELLSSQLLKATESSEHHQRIAAATEALLTDVQQKTQSAAAAHDERVKTLVDELAAAHRDLSAFRLKSLNAIQEEENAREQLRSATREFNEKVASCEETSNSYRQQQEQAAKEAVLLKAELAKQQQMMRASHANYERELQLHARAEKALREQQEECDRAKEQLAAAEAAAQALESAQQQTSKRGDAQSAAALEENAELKRQLEDLRARHDAMHGSVRDLEAQVQQRAMSLATEVAVRDAAEGATDGAVEGAKVSELKEEVRQLQTEMDIQSKKLSRSQGDATTAGAQLAATQRTLDEVRVQLQQREAELAAASVCSREEFERLRGEAHQLQLIRESNSHLRTENDAMSKQLQALKDAAKTSRDKVAPFEERLRVLTGERDALVANNAALTTDASYWRERMHQLVSQYNEVDPVEHRQLQVRLGELQKAQDKTVADYEKTISEYEERLAELMSSIKGLQDQLAKQESALADDSSSRSKLEEEVRSIKATNEGLDKSNTKFRNLCREFKDKIAENTKKMAELAKREEEAKAEGAAVAEELALLKRAIPSAGKAGQHKKAAPAKMPPAAEMVAMEVEAAPMVAMSAAAKKGAKNLAAKATEAAAPAAKDEPRAEVSPPAAVPAVVASAAATAKKVAKKPVAKPASPAKEAPAVEAPVDLPEPEVEVAMEAAEETSEALQAVEPVVASAAVPAVVAPAAATAKKVAKKPVAKPASPAEEAPAVDLETAAPNVGKKRKQPTPIKALSPVAPAAQEAPVAQEVPAAPAVKKVLLRRKPSLSAGGAFPEPVEDGAVVAPAENFAEVVAEVPDADTTVEATAEAAAAEVPAPADEAPARPAKRNAGEAEKEAVPHVAAVAAASMKNMKEMLMLKRKKTAEPAASTAPAEESVAQSDVAIAKRPKVDLAAPAASSRGAEELLAAENSDAFTKTFFGEKKPPLFGSSSVSASPFSFRSQVAASTTPFKGFGAPVSKDPPSAGGHVFGSSFGASPFAAAGAAPAWGANPSPSPKNNPFGSVFSAVSSIFGAKKDVAEPTVVERAETEEAVEEATESHTSMLVEQEGPAAATLEPEAAEGGRDVDGGGAASAPVQPKRTKEKMTAEQLKALRIKRAARFNAEKDAEQG